MKSIIDKMIILSVRKSYAYKIEEDMRQHCFDFLKTQIDYCFESYYISHTKKPKKKEANNNDGKNEILWKTIKPKKNTWIELHGFFGYIDKNNCERIFRCIEEL